MGTQASCDCTAKDTDEIAGSQLMNVHDDLQEQILPYRHDRPTVVLANNGGSYTGQWVGRQRDGMGVHRFADGSVYTGQFVRNAAEGKGRLEYADGTVYDGEFQKDSAHGAGTITFRDGFTYTGQWAMQEPDGEGMETWEDSTTYRGQYKNGEKHGRGKLTFADGAVFEGMIERNTFQGPGSYSWKDGASFEGQYRQGLMHGTGVYRWGKIDGKIDGRVYKGEYVNNVKAGHGRFEWPTGKVYEGQWKAGKCHGRGNYTPGEDEVLEKKVWRGEWENGERVRWIVGPDPVEDDLENLYGPDKVAELEAQGVLRPGQDVESLPQSVRMTPRSPRMPSHGDVIEEEGDDDN